MLFNSSSSKNIYGETTNYGWFNPYVHNRKFKEGNFNRIKESMKKYGFDKDDPIIVDKDGNIIRGHHRFFAAKELEISVSYKITESPRPINDVEGSGESWTSYDHLDSWISRGKQDYIKIRDYIDETGIKISDVLTMAAGYAAGEEVRSVSQSMKKGTFEIKDYNHPKEIGNTIMFLKENGIYWASKSYFVRALSRAAKLPGFSLKDFESQSLKHIGFYKQKRTMEEYIRMVQKIYNYKQVNSKKLPIHFLIVEQREAA